MNYTPIVLNMFTIVPNTEKLMNEVPETFEEQKSEEDTPLLRIYIEIQFTTANPCYRSRLRAPST
jgi:hypothetical protein